MFYNLNQLVAQYRNTGTTTI